MAADNDIITLNQVRAYLGVKDGFTDNDSQFEEYITLCSGAIEEYTQRKFAVQEITEYLDGDGTDFLVVSFPPVHSLVGVSEALRLDSLQYRDADGTGDWTDVTDDEDYIHIDQSKSWRIQLLGGDYFPEGIKNIKVVYNTGWAQVDIPADVQKVALEMVASMWDEAKKSGVGRLGQSSQGTSSMGGNLTTAYVDMHPRWARVLDRYRLVSI